MQPFIPYPQLCLLVNTRCARASWEKLPGTSGVQAHPFLTGMEFCVSVRHIGRHLSQTEVCATQGTCDQEGVHDVTPIDRKDPTRSQVPRSAL